MGVAFYKKSGKWGVFFCKKVDLSSTQGALCTVQYQYFLFYILLIWGCVRTQRTPPAYGPELSDIDQHRPRLSEGEVQRRFPHPQITAHS